MLEDLLYTVGGFTIHKHSPDETDRTSRSQLVGIVTEDAIVDPDVLQQKKIRGNDMTVDTRVRVRNKS